MFIDNVHLFLIKNGIYFNSETPLIIKHTISFMDHLENFSNIPLAAKPHCKYFLLFKKKQPDFRGVKTMENADSRNNDIRYLFTFTSFSIIWSSSTY